MAVNRKMTHHNTSYHSYGLTAQDNTPIGTLLFLFLLAAPRLHFSMDLNAVPFSNVSIPTQALLGLSGF